MDLLIARVLDGFNNGVIYGFLGLALVCVYRGTGHLNLAQGEMAMFCAFLAYAFIGAGLPVPLAILLVVAIGFVGGATVERFLIRPLGHDAEYPILLVTVGIFLALNAGAGVIWGGDPLVFPTVVPSGPDDYIAVLGQRLHYQKVVIAGLLAACLAVLYALFRYTRIGLAMRASSSNPDSTLLLGVPVHRINSLGWAIAAGVGALLGPLVAPSTTLNTMMMLHFILYACAAATLGGFDSPAGTVFAGVMLGVVENIVASYVGAVGSDLKQGVTLLILLAVLMIRPSGLFGSQKVERI
ncbi:branched-chain amino acid ABC transporter permease [Nocardioides humi]|uniref:Branched-chain amino acid ABC transporter permease n=1 Tax=Nocardioides humi TaxID=449461 RepID=A0ABN2BPU4_9ACTN|nr:branched-chain amino acid ABC transporter permease [Nocardioides humi]